MRGKTCINISMLALKRIGSILLLVAVAWLLTYLEKPHDTTRSDSFAQNSGVQTTKPIKSYEDARKVFWRDLYSGEFTTLYCGESYVGLPSRTINIEHVFPMGWVTHALQCGTRKQCRSNVQFNLIESDLHNLFPSRSDVNEQRGSLRFGEIPGEAREFGSACDFEVNKRARMVEPRPEVRGDIARAMFYMQDRYRAYGLSIYAKQAKLLKRWHVLDPPDVVERWRNERIESLQGNRNPYIDNPDSL